MCWLCSNKQAKLQQTRTGVFPRWASRTLLGLSALGTSVAVARKAATGPPTSSFKDGLVGVLPTLLMSATVSTVMTVALRTAFFPRPVCVSRCVDVEKLRTTAALQRKQAIGEVLSEAIQLQTISFDKPTPEQSAARDEATLQLHKLLQNRYPKVHASLERTVINTHSLLFEWKGSDPALQPYLLYAHMDVVPVEDAELWGYVNADGKLERSVHPFSGLIDNGYVWGRGAIDDKQAVVTIMEAVEQLITAGFKPKRTLFLAFGHDEEVAGTGGALHIAEHLKRKNIKLAFMHDEGLMILTGALKGMSKPIAFVCCSEKGGLTLQLSTVAQSGHSSAPPNCIPNDKPKTAIGIISNALARLERYPCPPHLDNNSVALLEHIASEFRFPMRIIACNLWLFGPLVRRIFSRVPTSATTVRTTTALTMVSGGVKPNVLAASASAVVNHRVHPRETLESVIEYDKRIISDDRISVSILNSVPIAPVSSTDGIGFHVISDSVMECFPEALVAPAVMTGNTDSRHFWEVSEAQYRFSPTQLSTKGFHSVTMFHGRNEKITLDNLALCVAYYQRVIERTDAYQS